MLKIYGSREYTRVDTELTREQRLADLDYMYELVCLDSPSKELYEQAYKISYEDVYNTYRDYVADCESEIEYLGYMSSFLSVLPGQHNYMYLPPSCLLPPIYSTASAQDSFTCCVSRQILFTVPSELISEV